MELTERQKQYLIQLDKQYQNKCDLGHYHCGNLSHYSFIVVNPDNHKRYRVVAFDESGNPVNKYFRLESKILTDWSIGHRDETTINNQNETWLLHHNYNERLYSGITDIKYDSLPIYSFVSLNVLINQVTVTIRINTTSDTITIDILDWYKSLPVNCRKQLKSGRIGQKLQASFDAILIKASREYLHYST